MLQKRAVRTLLTTSVWKSLGLYIVKVMIHDDRWRLNGIRFRIKE